MSATSKKQLFSQVLDYFRRNMPDAESELHFANPFQLVVAVVLSAQCTDQRVNQVTPALFAAYPTPQAMAAATADEVFAYIHSVSYPNNKSRHLVGLAQMLVQDYGGEVPTSVDELQRLPGVGRKTANVVVAVAFGQAAMPVDTHVFRVAERIGLTTHSKSPLHTERTLVRYIPEGDLSRAHHWLLLHGRYVCQARKPHCEACGLTQLCRHYQKQLKATQDAV